MDICEIDYALVDDNALIRIILFIYIFTFITTDSLEHIDYSICTLEFETRRESYFWVLEALDLYRPKV